MNERLTTGAILSGTAALLRAHPMPALVSVAVLAVAAALFDVREDGGQLLNLLVALGGVAAQYMVTLAVLRGENLQRAPGRVGSFIGVSILSGIAIALGTLLLILPGLYLFARWSIAMPLVIGEGKTMDEAMRGSTEKSAGYRVPIMMAGATISLCGVAAAAVMVLGYPAADVPSLPVALAANLLFYSALVGTWYLAIAVYQRIAAPAEALGEIFA